MIKKMYFTVFALLLSLIGASVCYGEDLEMSIAAQSSKVELGTEFTVDFNITKNIGFNNYTFFVDFDPDYITPVAFTDSDDVSDWIKASDGTNVVTKELINKQLAVVATSSDSDYEGLGADGVKTAAELGRIKLSGRIYTSSGLEEVSDLGKLFSLKFVAEKNSNNKVQIKITPVNSGFSPAPQSDKTSLTTLYDLAEIEINATKEVTIDGTIYEINADNGQIVSVTTTVESLNVPSVIEDTVIESMGIRAFANAKSVKYLNIADTVKTIDEYCFEDCTNLESVTLAYKTVFGKGAFSGCTNLKSVTFRD